MNNLKKIIRFYTIVRLFHFLMTIVFIVAVLLDFQYQYICFINKEDIVITSILMIIVIVCFASVTMIYHVELKYFKLAISMQKTTNEINNTSEDSN